MNYSKYSRAAEEEKGRSNKTFYVITCTKYRKRMVKRKLSMVATPLKSRILKLDKLKTKQKGKKAK